MTDDLDRMLSGGAKSAFNKTTPLGTTVTGIVRDITVRQATEYGTGAPQFFPSGDPKEQITAFRDSTRSDIEAIAQRLETLQGNWNARGKFRAAPHRVLLRIWPAGGLSPVDPRSTS